MTEDPSVMETMGSNFYNQLYSLEGVSGMEEALDTVPVKVTRDIYDMLMAPYSANAVKLLCS